VPVPEIIGGSTPVGALITGARLLGRVFDSSGGITVEEFRAQRRTPAGRELELGRRGELTRDQLVARLNLTGIGGPIGATQPIPGELRPPDTIQIGPPISPGGVPTLTLPGLGGVIPGLMGQIGVSTPGVGTATRSPPLLERLPTTRLEELLRSIRNARLREGMQRIARAAMRVLPAVQVATVIEGILTPREIASGELTREQVRDALERFQQAVDSLKEINELPRRQTATDRRGLGGDIVINEPMRPGGLGPPTWEQLPPMGAREPAPTSREREGLLVRVRRGLQQNLERVVIGAIGLGTLSLLRRGSTSAPFTFNIPQAIPAPLSPPAPQPLTVVQGGGVPSSPTAQRMCECKPKKKKKSRKCLERAQVEWRTGRYKGKLAGTRCVRFEG